MSVLKSRECQKSAWRAHWDTCKRLQTFSDEDMAISWTHFSTIRKKANMAAINTCGLRVLSELGRDPSRALRDISWSTCAPITNPLTQRLLRLLLSLTRQWYLPVIPVRRVAKVLELLADKNNFAKSIGFMGALVVMLTFENAGKTHRIRFPIVFENNTLKNALQHDTSITPWLVQLKAAINDGIL